MDNVFSFRDRLIEDYSTFSRSFSRIAAEDIRLEVERQYAEGRYWPEPLIQINPNYQRKASVRQLAESGDLHPACAEIFQAGVALLVRRLRERVRAESLICIGTSATLDAQRFAPGRQEQGVELYPVHFCRDCGEAQRTLRFIIGYRVIRDLRRGWRFNNPNLDQLGLLEIGYRGMGEFCAEDGLFSNQPTLSALHPEHRARLCHLIFEEMRGSLCLQSRYLDPVEQDQARTQGYQHLNERWALAADEYHGQQSEVDFYKAIFDVAEMMPWKIESLRLAQDLAQRYGIAAMDAIHAAIALSARVDECVTAERPEKPLFRLTELTVVSIR